MKTKTCAFCGKEFETGRGYQKYCCYTCQQEARKKPRVVYKKTCKICGKAFETIYSNQLCCSQKCSDKNNRAFASKRQKHPVEKKLPRCVVCGREFTPKHEGQKYCSHDCHDDPLARSLRIFFVLMLEKYNVDVSTLERVDFYDC